MKKRLLHILFIGLIYNTLHGVNGPVYVNRVCLNKFTNELNIRVNVTDNDLCGSFKFHRVYGREDASSPFRLLAEVNTLVITDISTFVPNNKKWEVYVSTHSACNGLDSFNSNRLLVDDVAPTLFEPDSVSVYYANQNLVAGWSKPPINDIKGFSLFKENGGTNLLLKDTYSLYYSFSKSVFNPSSFGTIKFSIAAFDSCLNGGILSSYHSPPYLNIQVDANYYCSRKCTLNLTPYVGWKSDSFWVYRYNNSTGSWTMLQRGAFLGGSFLLIDSNLQLDVTYDYFFRCKRTGMSITSSSNKITIQLPSPPKTNPSSIDLVTINANKIDLSGSSGILNSGFSYVIEKRTTPATWSNVATFKNSNSSAVTKAWQITDGSAVVNANNYFYRILRLDNCGDGFDTSNIHSNLWLRKGSNRSIYWNRYWGWMCLNCSKSVSYNLKHYNTVGGFWETVTSFNTYDDTVYSLNSTWEGIKRFKVEATDNNTGLVSVSNELLIDLGYDNGVKDTLLIPSAFTPDGLNPTFKISNPAIGLGESTIGIYNRWGEKIWEGDAVVGWSGKDLNGNSVGDGLYIYHLTAVYRNKRVVESGSVLLLR